eukprot:CAMPEP_0176050234 /NCGR_PEP_ID=MMETSP0120_2-20121206/24967_1 /TAXON_ID=160619 /ORGANISM="Kryptoperidinium foliaceum, Strain CCMP 1326" /LENGTH=161 /DNA_ID=CAMNT_0017383667 /DNA_START=32 /DNA_END=517 /DNA_ORIENTATION=-
MKYVSFLFALVALLEADAFSPQANKAALELKKAAGGAFAAFTIGSSILNSPIANAVETQPFTFSSTNVVAEKVTRQGLYSEYEVDIVQERDDARSTFKGAEETKSKKGKYTAILAILIVGSFIVPMAQYFWYVKDDDSSDRFFASQDIPDPEPPKKKGWFN